MSENVELVGEDAPQHALTHLLLGHEQVEEVAALLPATVGFGVAAVGQRHRPCPAGRGDVRLHRAGTECRADDSLRLELGTHAFHHVDGGALGSAVDRGARMRHESGHRSGIDDVAAFAVREHARQQGDDAVDGAAEIDTHDPVPIGEGRQCRGPDDGDAGVVAEQVNLAEARLGRGRGARKILPVGDVELERQYGLRPRQLRSRGAQVILANIRDDHVHAGSEQRLGDAESYATAAPGDERGLAGEILHTVGSLKGNGGSRMAEHAQQQCRK